MMVGVSTWLSLASAVLMSLMALQETSAQVFDADFWASHDRTGSYHTLSPPKPTLPPRDLQGLIDVLKGTGEDYYPESTKAPTHPGKCPSWCKTTAGKFKCCLDIIESDITVQVRMSEQNLKSEQPILSEVPKMSEAIEYTEPTIDDIFTVTESYIDSELTTIISVDDIPTIVPDLTEVANKSSEADLSLVYAWSVFVLNNTNTKKGQTHPVNYKNTKKGPTHPSLCPSWCKTTAGKFKCCLDIVELCPADSHLPLGSCPHQDKCRDSHGCYEGEVCCWDRCYGHGVCVEPHKI